MQKKDIKKPRYYRYKCPCLNSSFKYLDDEIVTLDPGPVELVYATFVNVPGKFKALMCRNWFQEIISL